MAMRTGAMHVAKVAKKYVTKDGASRESVAYLLRQRRQVRQRLVPHLRPVAVRAPQQVGHRLATGPILGHVLLRNLGYVHRTCLHRHTRQDNEMMVKIRSTTRRRLGYIYQARTKQNRRSTRKSALKPPVTSD